MGIEPCVWFLFGTRRIYSLSNLEAQLQFVVPIKVLNNQNAFLKGYKCAARFGICAAVRRM